MSEKHQDYHYKIVRIRDNGKVHIYPEEILSLEDAKVKMQQSSTGKYFGHCRVFCFIVYNGRAYVVGKQGRI